MIKQFATRVSTNVQVSQIPGVPTQCLLIHLRNQQFNDVPTPAARLVCNQLPVWRSSRMRKCMNNFLHPCHYRPQIRTFKSSRATQNIRVLSLSCDVSRYQGPLGIPRICVEHKGIAAVPVRAIREYSRKKLACLLVFVCCCCCCKDAA